MRRLVPALAALAVLLAPPAALAATVEADTSDYPVVRAIFVSESASVLAPEVTENGQPVADLVATNLGRAKSISLLIDRSQSMAGQPLADAVDAARAFVAAKPPEDRIAVTTYATQPVVLTSFQASTTDADSALRTIEVDPAYGTTLYDAVVVSANSLASETYLGRVVIVVTDGNETRSKAELEDAIAAAHNAGASVYVVGIESSLFNPEPLEQLAEETGGNYYPAASSEALDEVYTSIAEELSRTWRLEYVTAALPSEKVDLVAKTGSETASARLVAPGAPVVKRSPAVEGRLPEQFFGSVWGQAAFATVVGLLVLIACGFLFAAPKGAWLRGRLDPHLATRRRAVKESGGRERVRFARSLFHATEATLGKFKPWKSLSRMLERADLPLRTPEFVYVMVGAGLLAGLLAAGLRMPVWLVGLKMVAGAFLPYGFVAIKARRRVKAFENQLPDLLVTMAAGLKAGHSFRQALQSVVDEDQPPASKELKRVLTETRLGRPMDEALLDMAQRIGSKNLEFVITAVSIQRQVGGSLASLFDMVADTVRNRQQFAKKIKGLTAMGRASAYVLIGLPFFVAGLLTLLNADYMRPLWHTGTGHKLIMVMFVMMTFGSLVLRKIVNFRY
ncbi:MAG TPA: type II secretion system F family protein [Gaiellaceae bacterium]|nr:type II secretion system F family protein [Gaiellaceae bacterium]